MKWLHRMPHKLFYSSQEHVLQSLCHPVLHVCPFNVECLIKANRNRRFVEKQKNKNSIPWNFKSFLGQTNPSLAVSFELNCVYDSLTLWSKIIQKSKSQDNCQLSSLAVVSWRCLVGWQIASFEDPLYHFFKTLPLGQKLKTTIEKNFFFQSTPISEE